MLDNIDVTNLTLNTRGEVTDRGSVNVAELFALDAGNADVFLDLGDHSIGTLSIDSGEVELGEVSYG